MVFGFFKINSILLLFAFVNFYSVNAQRACPAGWLINENLGFCYKLGTANVASNWTQAKLSCEAYKAELYYIKSAEERMEFDTFVNRSAYPQYWIGGLRRSDGAWIWSNINDNVITNNYIQDGQVVWDAGKPDQNGDCLQVAKNGSYSNQDCSQVKPYICKRPMGLATGCDIENGWEPVEDSCIKMIQKVVDYDSSRDLCQNEGGDMAIVKTEIKQTYLRDWAKIFRKSFWIGLSDRNGDNGVLQWVNNDNVKPDQYWQPGQPALIVNNGTGGNCTVVDHTTEGQWRIDNCDSEYNLACERPPGDCPDNWLPFKDRCYLFNSNTQKYTSWFDANTTCFNYGAELLTINDKFEQQFINRELKSTFSTYDYWLGLIAKKDNSQNITWSLGSPLGNFTNWLPGQPISSPIRDSCALLTNPSGLWYLTSNCFQMLPFVCEIDIGKSITPNPSSITTYGGTANGKPCVFPFIYKDTTYYECIVRDRDNYWCSTTTLYDKEWGYCKLNAVCDEGWTEIQGFCFKYNENSTGVTHAEAAAACTTTGGYLAAIKSDKIQSGVDKLITNAFNAVWIGLEFKQNTNWTWLDNSQLTSSQFSNWRFNHPNVSAPLYCASLDVTQLYLGEWQSTPCASKYNNYICQKPSTGLVIPTVTSSKTTAASARCGPNWVERPFSSLCYHFSPTIELYSQAEQNCKNMGGQMLSIIAVDEQIFVQSFAATLNNDLYWIGVKRGSLISGWTWSDSSPFIFTNWAQSEPSGSPGRNCAVMSSNSNGQWRTTECESFFEEIKYNYICKKPANDQVASTSTVFPTRPGVNYGCERGWGEYKNNCYKYFNSITDHVSFSEAKVSCRNERADLVEIFSEAENDFLISLLRTRAKNEYRCPGGWTQNYDQCYFISTQAERDWKKAQAYCTRVGGFLVSIKSQDVQNFIANLANKDLWIGLIKINGTNFWEYADNTIASGQYSYWDGGFPTNTNSTDRCGVLRASGNKKWYDVDCLNTVSFDYVCQQEASVQDKCTQFVSPITGGGGTCVHKEQCPDDLYYPGLCGEYNDPDLECCLGASRIRETVWMGMYDELNDLNQVSFKYLSGQTPTYTNWGANQPTTDAGCVGFLVKDTAISQLNLGRWFVTPCNYKNGYLCKKPVLPVPTTPYIQDPGCPPGFKAYETKCFLNVLEYLPWEDAERNCQTKYGANLVAVLDRFQQYWLNQFGVGTSVRWIGLSDRQKPGTYVWSTNETVTFSNWDKNRPDNAFGNCIGMNSNGFWSNVNCTDKYPSICMTSNPIYTTVTYPTLPPIKCAQGWFESDNKCYRLFSFTNSTKKLNWFEADSFCKKINGFLPSFRTAAAITQILNNFGIYSFSSGSYWIGLNKLDPNAGYQWTDGTAASFFNWDFGQPDDKNGIQNCVELIPTNRWRDAFCYLNKDFFCQIDKGLNPNIDEVTPDISFEIVECPNNTNYNWTLYKGKCYYVSTGVGEERVNWYKARDFCRNIGGDLLSIHSRKELEYTATIAGKKLSKWWIGLYKYGTSGFVWSDGSPLNFINWNYNEPSDSHGGENCVEMSGTTAFWNDDICGVEAPFICEKSSTGLMPEPEVVLPLSFNNGESQFCSPGYSTFGVSVIDNDGKGSQCEFPFKYKGNLYYECVTFENRNPWCATTFDYDTDKKWGYCLEVKCFRLVKNNLKYADARRVCQADGGSMSSVHNELEQAFLTALLRDARPKNHWIGLWAPSTNFVFEDNTIMDYSNWAPGKPGSLATNERCVVMSGAEATPGRWINVNGDTLNFFTCSKYANGVNFATGCEASNKTSLSQNVTLTCPKNQNLSLAIIKADFGRDIYSMACDDEYNNDGVCTVRATVTDKVRELCNNKANCYIKPDSVMFTDLCPNVVKQLRVWYQCVNFPIKTTNGGECVFPFKYNNITHHQCTYEKINSQPNVTKWCCLNSNCDANLQFGECQKSTALLESNGCKEGYQSVDNGMNCYKVYDTMTKTWREAIDYCKSQDNATLVTVTDGFEQSFVRLITYGKLNPWIGMFLKEDGEFEWSDKWPVEYTNIHPGQADSLTNGCLFIDSTSGYWNISASCNDTRQFVCKTTKETLPVVTQPPPGYCRDGWTPFGNQCYRVETTTRSLPEAKFDCAQKLAYLVSIHNRLEQLFVDDLIVAATNLQNQPVWIGLEKSALSGSYEWLDGSSLTFTNFAKQNETDTCIYTQGSLWYGSDCLLFRRRYVCKSPRIVTTPDPIVTTQTTTQSTSSSTPFTFPTTTATSSSSSSSSTFRTTTTTPTTSTSTRTTARPTTSTTRSTARPIATTTTKKIDEKKSSSLGGGAIFGIVVAVLLAALLLIVVVLFVLKKNNIIKKNIPVFDQVIYNRYETKANVSLVTLNNPNFDNPK